MQTKTKIRIELRCDLKGKGCGDIFHSYIAFKKHMETNHCEIDFYSLDIAKKNPLHVFECNCGELFESHKLFNEHFRNKHQNIKSYNETPPMPNLLDILEIRGRFVHRKPKRHLCVPLSSVHQHQRFVSSV